MAKLKLSQEEKDILDSYENNEWISVKNEESMTKYQAIAQATLKKDEQISIRISAHDLKLLQEKALIEGIPYQTLISSILHKYITNEFSERGKA